MGQGTVPPGLLVEPGQLSRYNVPSSFLAQFEARPFLVQISTAGALGTMQFIWQYPGDASWSAPVVSTAGATWAPTVEEAFCDLTFAAATYGLGDTYAIDAAGQVTGPSGNLSAARFDLRLNACSAATLEALMLMRDAIRPPLTVWGDDATTHAAAMAYAILKRGRGATPDGAGDGDAVVFSGEGRAIEYFKSIGEKGRPDSMTDTSPTVDGPLIPVYPFGNTLRGW